MAHQGLGLILAAHDVDLASGILQPSMLADLMRPERAVVRLRLNPGMHAREHDEQVGRSPAVLPGAFTNLAARDVQELGKLPASLMRFLISATTLPSGVIIGSPLFSPCGGRGSEAGGSDK